MRDSKQTDRERPGSGAGGGGGKGRENRIHSSGKARGNQGEMRWTRQTVLPVHSLTVTRYSLLVLAVIR